MDLESDPKHLSPFYKDVLAFLEAIHERLDGLEQAATRELPWEVCRTILLANGNIDPEMDRGPERGEWEPFAASASAIWWRRRVQVKEDK